MSTAEEMEAGAGRSPLGGHSNRIFAATARANAAVPKSGLNPNVTATVTRAHPAHQQATTSPAELNRKFLESVLAWPDANGPGWINMHVNMKNTTPEKNGGKPWVIGWPYRDINEFINRALWIDNTDRMFNVWLCMSQQSETGKGKDGKLKALRNVKNAAWLRSIWIDIDVKDSGNNYQTIKDARAAVVAFRQKVGLPFPSACVNSGGGLHVYWTSDKPLSPEEWRPYADGLKALLLRDGVLCDAGLTTDAARLLRVPGTLNHKYSPPRPVELLHLGSNYKFETDLHFLKDVSSRTQGAPVSQERTTMLLEPRAVFDAPDPAFAGLSPTEALAEPQGPKLVDPRPIFEKSGCGFLSHALDVGGADYDNPLWNLSVLCTAFMDNGNAIAHEISKGHPSYTEAETQAWYERKLADRAERGIGWPSCATIHGAGCKSCAGCPHRNNVKSPLNLATFRHQPGQTSAAAQNCSDPLDFSLVPPEEAVERINAAGFFVLTSNGDIYREDAAGTVIAQRPAGFSNIFACRKVPGVKGPITADKVWLSSPLRREHAQIGYWPGGHACPAKAYNLFRGWGIQPVSGDCSIIENHILEVVAGGDQKKANFILDWCAHMVQRPWEKPGVALVLRGKKGTGKTLFTQLIVRCVGDRNALVTANGKQLFGQFNWHLADKLLIVAEEAFFVGNHELNDRLKHLLTGDTFEAEQKFGQRVSMKSMHRVIMASNHDQVVAATDDERRFVVCDVSDDKRGDDAYFAPLVKIVKGQDDATLAAFMHHLQTRDISNFRPERDARSAGRRDLARQKLLGLEPPLQWLLEEVALRDPADATQHNTSYDTGLEDRADADLDERVSALAAKSPAPALAPATAQDRLRNGMLADYRYWVTTARVRGASDYTGAEVFWNSIKRLLNRTIFPGRTLFRASGGKRYVCLPPPDELIEGFNKLLGANVINADEDSCD
jgi:hypothetical protein